MGSRMKMSAHPRLFVGRREIERLVGPTTLPFLRQAERLVEVDAERGLRAGPVELSAGYNAHLLRARAAQVRVFSFLVRWLQTGDEGFRSAVVRTVREIGDWEHWSWAMSLRNDSRPEADFDLSYGENSATLAIAYDLLSSTLSDQERAMFIAVARERSLKPFLRHARPNAAYWYGRKGFNWNGVCAGGTGLLALAMYEMIPEAAPVLRAAERSLRPFIRDLERTAGAWEEGVHYWCYGMRYAFLFLLSHERATGLTHPLLALPVVRQTLYYPLDFCPHGQSAGFGDGGGLFTAMPFHYAMAERLGCKDLPSALDALLPGKMKLSWSSWPDAAGLLLLHPRSQGKPGRRVQKRVCRVYQGLDWGVLADQLPSPNIYLSVRGGTTEVSHGHVDLTSYHAVIGGEALIQSPGGRPYTILGVPPGRAVETLEGGSTAKNVVLVNGLGVAHPSRVKTETLLLGRRPAIRMDATAARGRLDAGRRGGSTFVTFHGRLFVLLNEKAALILDRVELPLPGLIESRLHTACRVRREGLDVFLTGKKSTGSVLFAAEPETNLIQDRVSLSGATTRLTVLRWHARGQVPAATFATVIRVGDDPGSVTLRVSSATIRVQVSGDGWGSRVVVDKRLHQP